MNSQVLFLAAVRWVPAWSFSMAQSGHPAFTGKRPSNVGALLMFVPCCTLVPAACLASSVCSRTGDRVSNERRTWDSLVSGRLQAEFNFCLELCWPVETSRCHGRISHALQHSGEWLPGGKLEAVDGEHSRQPGVQKETRPQDFREQMGSSTFPISFSSFCWA